MQDNNLEVLSEAFSTGHPMRQVTWPPVPVTPRPDPRAASGRIPGSSRPTSGFTLIELTVVVALLGIMAAIAVPAYMNLKLRAARTELPVMTKSLRMLEASYHDETGAYVDTSVSIGYFPYDEDQLPSMYNAMGALQDLMAVKCAEWKSCCTNGDTSTEEGRNDACSCCMAHVFACSGDSPRYSTYVTTVEGESYTITAISDLDSDGDTARFEATHISQPVMKSANNIY